MTRPHRLLLLVVCLGLGAAGLLPAAAGAAKPLPLNTIGASLPTVESLPGANLRARSARLTGTARNRAPFPCSDYSARSVRATSHWGEWEARGGKRRVRVITFSYGDERIDAVWKSLRSAIMACPSVLPYTDQGGAGTSTQLIRSVTANAITFDLRTRSADGSRQWGDDRAITYQRVGDAIQKVQVARPTLTRAERRLLKRLARLSSTRYSDARSGTIALDTPGEAPAGPQIGDVSAPLREAIAKLPAGQTLNVSLGDSFISGEAGRWRGNVYWHLNGGKADAYGPSAYWDTPTGEAIRGCHRAKGAEIHVPGTVGVNLACSGAITTSKTRLGNYKPGIDDGMIDPKSGAQLPGQLTLLDELARSSRVGVVVVSIGGNDMGFSDVIRGCVTAFMKPWPFQSRCADDPAVRDRLSDPALTVVGGKVEEAIVRIHGTMKAAGYTNGSWQMIVQNYPKPIAEDARYPETVTGRLVNGGCPLYSSDVRWVNTRIPALTESLQDAARRAATRTGQPIRFLDLTDIFAGRELCAKGAEQVDKLSADEITARGERVQMLRVFTPWSPAEAIHPNQLGQQALQACLREALNNGSARSGRCDAPGDWSKVDRTGLPIVRFAPTM